MDTEYLVIKIPLETLSPRQALYIDFISKYIKETGKNPTLAAIATHFDRTPQTVIEAINSAGYFYSRRRGLEKIRR